MENILPACVRKLIALLYTGLITFIFSNLAQGLFAHVLVLFVPMQGHGNEKIARFRECPSNFFRRRKEWQMEDLFGF
jgi:hypothetical protein